MELTPPSPGELGQVVKGAGGLVKDALTFKWAQVELKLMTKYPLEELSLLFEMTLHLKIHNGTLQF